jgi:hypothetical protein
VRTRTCCKESRRSGNIGVNERAKELLGERKRNWLGIIRNEIVHLIRNYSKVSESDKELSDKVTLSPDVATKHRKTCIYDIISESRLIMCSTMGFVSQGK